MKWSLLCRGAASYSNARAGASFSTVTRSRNGREAAPAAGSIGRQRQVTAAACTRRWLNNRPGLIVGIWQPSRSVQRRHRPPARTSWPVPERARRLRPMSALFSFSSFLVVLLLTICTCTYVKGKGARAAAAPLGLHLPLLHSLLTPACPWDPHLLQPRACSTSAPGEGLWRRRQWAALPPAASERTGRLRVSRRAKQPHERHPHPPPHCH